MAACARGPFCWAMIQKTVVENIHALRGTQIEDTTATTERQHSLLTVLL